MRNLKVTW